MSATVHEANGSQKPTATRALYKSIGREVWLWSKTKCASRKEIQNYAKQAFHKAGISNFKASEGWYRRWNMKWKRSEELNPKTETNTPERLNLFNESENLIDELPSFISCEDGIVDLFDGEFAFTSFENIDFYDSSLSCSYLKEENAEISGLKNDPKRTHKKRGERYLPQFKTKVIDFALKNSIREAVAEFNVNKSTISDWLRSVPRINTTENKINVDSDFIKWLQTERTRGHLVTQEEIIKKLKEININILKADHWLVKYSVRLLKTEEKARISYPRKFKKEIALLSTNYSKKKVSLVFKIDRKRIKEWVESLKVSDDKPVIREAKHYLTDENIDRKIWDWYQKQTSKPNSQQIRKMALTMYHDAGYKNMTCSAGWYYRWRKRYSLLKCTREKSKQDTDLLIWVLGQFENNKTVLHADLLNRAAQASESRRKPSSSWAVRFSKRFVKTLQGFPNPDVELPTILENECLNFQNAIADKKLLADSFLAFDEIPLNFNPSGSTKSVTLLRKSGFDNSHASLIICCRADGTFLPTTLITKSSVNINSPSIYTLVQENGLNDAVTMKNWIHLIIPFLKNISFFICDIYEPHNELKNNEKFDVAFIPIGCTPKLQPISYGISQKFKDEIENQWIQSQKKSSWKSKSIQVPSLDDIHLWVLNAHTKIVENDTEFVKNCFIKAGYLLL